MNPEAIYYRFLHMFKPTDNVKLKDLKELEKQKLEEQRNAQTGTQCNGKQP